MEVIKAILGRKKQSFRQLCIQYNINKDRAKYCRKKNPTFSDNEIIVTLRPDLSLNLFGEIIKI